MEFLDTTFVNLKFLTFAFGEYAPRLKYNKSQKSFNRSPNSFKNFLNYGDKLAAYNGKLRIKFNHRLRVPIFHTSARSVEDYMKELKKEFHDFEYSSKIEFLSSYYYYKKSSNVRDNIELNVELQLIYDHDCE